MRGCGRSGATAPAASPVAAPAPGSCSPCRSTRPCRAPVPDLHAGSLLPGVGLQAHGGAIADTADADAAFSHRGTMFEFGAGSRWTDPTEDGTRMAAARAAGATLDPYANGVYVNSLAADEGQRGIRRAYPAAKLARLTALKTVWDPRNVFHLNHNIRPGHA